MYSIKEIFLTIQGEGYHAGRAALFIRFAGCNLWSGFAKDRGNGKGECSRWCDTDFINGTKYTIEELEKEILIKAGNIRFAVVTGGEPLLQLDAEFINMLHANEFYIAVETNGTIKVTLPIDWICVSPKYGLKIIQRCGDELKFIYPQIQLEPKDFENCDFDHFYIQPLDDINKISNTNLCINYVMVNPQWKLSLQTHKYLGIP